MHTPSVSRSRTAQASNKQVILHSRWFTFSLAGGSCIARPMLEASAIERNRSQAADVEAELRPLS
jgi:hypothetical protein